MAENTSDLAFFREGLARYPEARETVDFFENSVLDALSKAFEEKTEWKGLSRKAQEAVLRRDQAATTELRNIQNRQAEHDKTATAEFSCWG